MLAKVQKWGNSQGLRFPKKILEEVYLRVGDEVNITIQEGKIIIEPAARVHGKYDIRELVNRMPADYQVGEVDWGNPVGREEW